MTLRMDITDWVKNPDFYRTLVETTQEGVWVVDADARTVFVNARVPQILGYPREEMLGKRIHDFLDAKDHRMADQKMERRRRGIAENFECPVVGSDGRVITCSVATSPLFEDGEFVGAVAKISDITQRVQAQEDFSVERDFCDRVINSLPGVIYMIDENMRLVRWNEKMEEESGYPHAQIATMRSPDFFAPEDFPPVEAAIREIFEKGESSVEADLLTNDGRKIPYCWTGKQLYVEGKSYFVGMGIDITARRCAEKERAALQKQLSQRRKMEALGRASGRIAHDFNNELTVIQLYAHELGESLGQESVAAQDLSEIKKACERAAGLTRQLLSFSRHGALNLQKVDLGEVLDSLEGPIRHILRDHIDLRIESESELWQVRTDRKAVEQMIFNLASNAADAMPGGGRLTIKTANVEIAAFPDADLNEGSYVKLSLTDTGHGMDADTAAMIFEPFFTTKEAGKGTGLGLSIVYGFIRQSGGNIRVHSETGKGATFEVFLPRG